MVKLTVYNSNGVVVKESKIHGKTVMVDPHILK